MLRLTAQLMTRVGLLNLRAGDTLAKVAAGARAVERRLYVAIPGAPGEPAGSLQRRLGEVYAAAFASAPEVDALVVLHDATPRDASALVGCADEAEDAARRGLPLVAVVPAEGGAALSAAEEGGEGAAAQFGRVCMGGTFDRLHVGQKLLLSMAAHSVRAGGYLFCGIAGDKLFKEKALRELIQPCGRRERVVRRFLESVRPDVTFGLAELTDGYGPSVTDASFEAIVVTEETAAGGAKCNAVRAEKGMPAMAVVTIGLLAQDGALTADLPHNEKLSSSGKRVSMVGDLLHGRRFLCRRTPRGAPYVIGVTGGIASGKSTAAAHLAAAHAEEVEVVNGDALGHEAYAAGTACNAQVREAFPAAAAPDGSIDRKVLGGIVFGNTAEMDRLTAIVWPRIRELIAERVARSAKAVVVLEAAVLAEAGWGSLCDEVWLCVVPPSLAKQRLMARNNLTEEEAEKRMASQLPSSERLPSAHVLLSNHAGVEELRAAAELAFEKAAPRREVCLEDLDGIAARWRAAAAEAGVSAERAAHWWREIRDRCETTGRDYHNLAHLEELLALADAHRAALHRPDLVAFAVFFHDAVYDAQAPRAQNERRSADLWRTFAAETTLPVADAEAVEAWIVRTAAHLDGPAEGDLAYFLDFDLAVLGRPAPGYFQYVEQIALEYSHMPWDAFRAGRKAVLETFAAKPDGPYFTEEVRGALAERCRQNIKLELEVMR